MRARQTFCRVMMLVWAGLLALPAGVNAQQASAGSFQAYTLSHSRAADVEPQLARLLAGLPMPPEIMADPRNNRLLVRGADDVQQLVRQMLATLDRPLTVEQSAPTLKSYPCPAAELQVVARQLQTVYAGQPEVRIATDVRTSQVLVLAPPEVQAQIARQLGHPAGDAPAVSQPAPPAATRPQTAPGEAHISKAVDVSLARHSTTRSVALKHLTWEQMEQSLRELTAGRLAPLPMTNGDTTAYSLSLPTGGDVQLSVNRQTRQIQLRGEPALLDRCVRLLQVLDAPPQTTGRRTRAVPVSTAREATVRKAVQVLASDQAQAIAGPADAAVVRPLPAGLNQNQPGGIRGGNAIPLVAKLFQNQAQPNQPADPNQPAPQQPPAGGQAAPGEDPLTSGLVGPVQIEFLEGLDIMVISGNQRDVDRVSQIIADIERLSAETEPQIEVLQLDHAGSEQVAAIVTQIYDQVLSPRQGQVSITPLVKPNALLLIGREESVRLVVDLVRQLDQPVGPTSQFSVFRLKHAAAADVATTITTFYTERAGLGTRVVVTPEFRTNSLIVQASPRDLAEVAELIDRIDTDSSGVVEELRVFPLQNSRAEELAPVLQDAISGEGGARPGIGPGAQGAQQAGAAGQSKSSMLKFSTIDPQGKRSLLTSGILTDVRITADPWNNAIIATGPSQSMDLVGELIRQLDRIPAAESQIKVFTIVNGDAQLLVQMLESLFGVTQQAGGGAGGLFGGVGGGLQAGGFIGENPLIGLRFSVDQRTNSIIASGSAGDLNIVEAILLRLDESDVRQRQSIVYRLKNAPALAVANTINDFLNSERNVQLLVPAQISPFQQIEREVVVVPEQVSNSLIVSATPRYFEEIRKIVEELDARPPMVMIQVLIAEVTLNNTDEFGVELGLQDSILFDRSLLGDIFTTTNTTQTPQGNTVVTTTNQVIQAATLTPGYNFNNQPLGNSGSAQSVASRENLAGQGLTNFSLGRINSELGYGGLVLSASSESISILIRALKECRRLDVLSRPQIMTLDNQPAFIQVGARVPRVQGVTQGVVGVAPVLNVIDTNVGLILGVTPRISPDGLVVMEIDAERSALGPEGEGVPITTTVNGDVIRSPLINTTTAQTTVSAVDGQTVVLGGLLTKAKTSTRRRVPLLSSIPIVGNLFRYDLEAVQRTELLIIMTPRIVRTEADADRVKQAEAARMSWCLADVKKLHGDPGIVSRDGEWSDDQTMVIYPDQNPTLAEPIPAPPGTIVVPPDALPPDALPPGALPPGVVPAPPGGVLPPGVVPPGAVPPGAVPPPGALPPPALIPPGGAAQQEWPIETRPQVRPAASSTPNTGQPASIMAPMQGPRLQPAPEEQSMRWPSPGQMNGQPGQVAQATWAQPVGASAPPGVLPANMPQQPISGVATVAYPSPATYPRTAAAGASSMPAGRSASLLPTR
jgi:type II secretion system protein D